MITMMLSTLHLVSANEYMGTYFDCSKTTTDRVITSIDFAGTIYANIPNNKSLSGVLSVASANSSAGAVGMVYQNALHLFNNGTIFWAPQYWFGGGEMTKYYDDVTSYGNYEALYLNMQLDDSNNLVRWKAYIYDDAQDIDRDSPTIYTWTQSDIFETYFLVGKETVGSYEYYYFQTGVESQIDLTCTWKLDTAWFGYHNGVGYSYRTGKSIRGLEARITYTGSNPYFVGGSTFNLADNDYSTYDRIRWKKGSSTLTSHTTLWSGSGDPEDYAPVSSPYI